MTTGTIQSVLVCVRRSGGQAVSKAPCTTVNGVAQEPALVSAYLIDPAQASLFDLAVEPLDAASVASVWSLSFSFVVLCFVVGRGVGSVLGLIRKG